VSATAITGAVVESGGAPFALESLELGAPQPDEVRVRIVASGICHTTCSSATGPSPPPMPAVLRPGRLALAQELGATHVVDAGREDPVEAIKALVPGGVERSLETSGVPGVPRQSVDVLGPDGTCGLIGAPPLGTEEPLDVNGVLSLGRDQGHRRGP
jgi:Zn-dependent alcohol dehydrogenase